MSTLYRYIFRQLFVAFAFFCLILGGLVWLTQAVRLIDLVLTSGQSLWQLVEFALYVLPKVLSVVIPLSGFAATIYCLNKLYSEAELVVMMSSGQGPMALARPLVGFGLVVGLLAYAMSGYMAPLGQRYLNADRAEIRSQLASALIREGRFIHPIDGVTIFIRETDREGGMQGLFLHDERTPATPVTYTAEEAVLVRDGSLARLVMRHGVALTYSVEDQTLGRVQFDSFTYDISALIRAVTVDPLDPDAHFTQTLLFPPSEFTQNASFPEAEYIALAHERITQALLGLTLPILALAILIGGDYQRRGFGARITAAILLGIAIIAGTLISKSIVLGAPQFWSVSYTPVAAGLTIAFLGLARASTSRNREASA